MTPATLLAKGRSPRRADVTLEAHLIDTAKAARRVFQQGTRLRRRWLAFFRVPSSLHDTFDRTLAVAALLHDLGKANADFYAAVTGVGHDQTLRHEHISALLLCLPEMRKWLATGGLDVDIVTAAVLSHHFKADDRKASPHAWCQPRGPRSHIELFLGHDEVARVLSAVATVANLEPAPRLTNTRWGATALWQEAWERGRRDAHAFSASLRKDAARRALHLAVKTGLIVADAASSALVREGYPIEAWIDDALHRPALTPGDIDASILAPRRASIERRGRTFAYHRFQTLAAEQGPRALLLAACGAGKTIAAWRWLSSATARDEIGSVLFLYPTRGTATEGFRDYVGWASAEESALVHGTARYELDRILENPPESLEAKRPGLSERDARLFSLALWPKRYFSATVDQFLAFLEHGYGATCLLPRLVDSAVVLDEVHSYDRRLFDALVAFLRHFDVPVLCMTATLGPSRRRELVSAGLDVFPKEVHREELLDLEAAENHPRYVLRQSSADEAFALACERAREGKRVLWVANTVARCQTASRAFADALGTPPITYHSRFRLEDRQKKHSATVSAFQSAAGALAVTTQVCEMSLDLDADVLVTEIAPVSSLVQRFGRANRHGRPGEERRAELRVIPAPSHPPYEKEELERAVGFVEQLAGHDLSQRKLTDALDAFSTREVQANGSARFLEAGYFAVSGSLRDDDDHGGPAILDADLPGVLAALAQRKPIDSFVVPAPRKMHVPRGPEHASLPSYLGVVPAEQYDPHLGLLSENHR